MNQRYKNIYQKGLTECVPGVPCGTPIRDNNKNKLTGTNSHFMVVDDVDDKCGRVLLPLNITAAIIRAIEEGFHVEPLLLGRR